MMLNLGFTPGTGLCKRKQGMSSLIIPNFKQNKGELGLCKGSPLDQEDHKWQITQHFVKENSTKKRKVEEPKLSS